MLGGVTDDDETADAFHHEHRAHVFAVAYRMLGSVTEAEDVVQDTWLRWSAVDRDTVRTPSAWLTTVATRLCLDRLRSARARREAYVGPWLPEPLVTGDDDPAAAAELADSLTMAFLVVLERLNPVERAVFLLHDVFGYPFADVAGMVDRPASSCRQVASRARAKVAPDRHPQHRPTPEDEQRLVLAFARAATVGDLDALVEVLTDDIEVWSDGGREHHAARRPVVGPARAARFLANLSRRLPPDAGMVAARLNGSPGFVISTDSGPMLALVLEVTTGGIRRVHAVVNPVKLAHLVEP